MAFIRFQKVKSDSSGKILSGSASIIDVQYVPGKKHHSKQVVREKLGKVIEIYSKKRGLFESPTRGLVTYDAEKDQFSPSLTRQEVQASAAIHEIADDLFPETDIHTVFGDVYLLIEVLKKSNFINILSSTFKEKVFYERLLCHILYGILRDGSRIACDDFIAKSFLSYCVEDIRIQSLKSDTAFFTKMGEDNIKVEFFRKYINFMRSKVPTFGRACFVDSTPLPNNIGSPFNALCSHGVSATSVQMRLVLVLDELTCLPIWYEIIPGNVLDINTLKTVTKDVEVTLDIALNGFILDAGYISKELIQNFEFQEKYEQIPEKRYLGRMPAKKGFPHRSLYTKTRIFFGKSKYDFIRKNHTYFGKVVKERVFETDVYCYVYIDYNNALNGYTQYIKNNYEDFIKMKDKEKDWYKVKFGFFVLISNYFKTPQEILDDYFTRTNIETVFKTDKEYLKLLPLCKWSDSTVRGKIFTDIINSIIRQKVYEYIKGTFWSISSIIGKCQSLMCFKDRKTDTVYVETPRKQVKDCYRDFEIKIPSQISISVYLQQLYPQNADPV